MKYIPKEIPEGINVTSRHPWLNFLYLLGTVVVATVLIFVVLGFVASFLATRISPEIESKIGDMLILSVIEDEIQDDKRIPYLKELLDSLPVSGEKTRLPLKIHLIKSDVINAAIMPGGHVLVHTALLENIGSENELAFVLAHELGHFQARDPLKSLGRSLVFMMISTVLGVGLSESGGYLPEMVQLTFDLTNLSYSRTQERNADIYGFSRVINRYGHGAHCLNFFNLLAKEEGRLQKVSKYFSTHPLSQERINDLSAKAAEKGWKMEGNKTPLPQWLHCPKIEPC